MVVEPKYKPNAYTQLYIHVVFAVKYRESLLHSGMREDLHSLIASTLTSNGHKPLAIGGMPDHMHILFGLNPNQAIAQIVKEIKRITSAWINESRFFRGHFSWQNGYGAFSYSRSQLDSIVKYIVNQPQHHMNITFLDEYRDILSKFGVAFNSNYIFYEPI